ncbi:MAG TPA: hypothetical protein VNA15_13035 [Candidatus Angelobacter sp.]|nr:hypothetical protein [Candidatus Angelobacter sp.]
MAALVKRSLFVVGHKEKRWGGRTANDRNVTELLTNLVKAGFVEKDGESYAITDLKSSSTVSSTLTGNERSPSRPHQNNGSPPNTQNHPIHKTETSGTVGTSE